MAVASDTKITRKDYQVEHANDWCPGCGDFGILSSVQQAMAGLDLPPHRVVIFGGIGCSGKTPYYLSAYGVHTLHGRVLPYATGAKLANPGLTVLAVGGDGDGMGIGAGHFVNTGRRNVDLTYILYNNEVYGLTKGQAAPTLPLGLQTKSMPEPNIQASVNSLMLAMTSGFTWIGRGYAYNVKRLIELTQQAIEHRGLAYLEVLQPCPTYNNLHTREWFGATVGPDERPRIYDVQDEGYDPLVPEGTDTQAISAKIMSFSQRAYEWGDRIPTGVLLENRSVPTFEERVSQRVPCYVAEPPALRVLADEQGVTLTDLTPMFDEVAVE